MKPSSATLPPPSTCPACEGTHIEVIGDMPLYVDGGNVPDTVVRCTGCGTYMRVADYADDTVRTHFNVASYTNTSAEERFRRVRIDWLAHLIRFALRHLGKPATDLRVLDIGPSYGHYVDLFQQQGARCTVVELVDILRERLAARGFAAHPHIDDIAPGETFDIVSAIDSLYYFQEPAAILTKMRSRIAPGGLLLLRVTNRPPTFALMRKLGMTMTADRFGDAKFNYSEAGITRLLERTGFTIDTIYLREPGKHHLSKTTALYYQLTLLASKLTGRHLTPGLTIIARPI